MKNNKNEQVSNMDIESIDMLSREDMTVEQEREFVEMCFNKYEKSGFTETFWTPYNEFKNKIGQNFSVIRRANEKDADLCNLPLWKIKFEDGFQTFSYPEEIIVSEIKNIKHS